MAFEGLKARIRRQAAECRDGGYLRELVDEAVALLDVNTPQASGRMLRNLRVKTELVESQTGFHMGLGPRERTGYAGRDAPGSTIEHFLADFPQYRGGPWNGRGAWWGLSNAGKAELERQRELGNYGGLDGGAGAGKSAYFYAQEGTFDGWHESAMRAGIIPTGFVAATLEDWRRYALPKVLRRFQMRFQAK